MTAAQQACPAPAPAPGPRPVRARCLSPSLNAGWNRSLNEVASPASYLKIFRHPARDRLVMTTNSLAVLAAPGTRMVVYTAADEATRIAVASLIAGEGGAARYPCWPTHHPPQPAVVPATAPAAS